MKTCFRKALSFIMSAVMVFSCIVFSTVGAGAQTVSLGVRETANDYTANGCYAYFSLSKTTCGILIGGASATSITTKPSLYFYNKGSYKVEITAVAWYKVSSTGSLTSSSVLTATLPTSPVSAGGSTSITYNLGTSQTINAGEVYCAQITYKNAQTDGSSSANCQAYVGVGQTPTTVASLSGTSTSKATGAGLNTSGTWYQAHASYTLSGKNASGTWGGSDASTTTKGGTATSTNTGALYIPSGTSYSSYYVQTKIAGAYDNKIEIWSVKATISGSAVSGASMYYQNTTASSNTSLATTKTFNSNSESTAATSGTSYSKTTNFASNYSNYYSDFGNSDSGDGKAYVTLKLLGNTPSAGGTYTLKQEWTVGTYNGFGNRQWCNNTSTLTLYVYNKTNISTSINNANKLGLRSSGSCTSTISTNLKKALYNACLSAAQAQVTQSTLDSNKTALDTAANDYKSADNSYAQYTQIDTIYSGDYGTDVIYTYAYTNYTSSATATPSKRTSGNSTYLGGNTYNRYTVNTAQAVSKTSRYYLMMYYWTVDTSQLQALMDRVSADYENSAKYTSSSYQVFSEAYSAAQAAIDAVDNTQEDIDSAQSSLQTAYNGLTFVSYDITVHHILNGVNADSAGVIDEYTQVVNSSFTVGELAADDTLPTSGIYTATGCTFIPEYYSDFADKSIDMTALSEVTLSDISGEAQVNIYYTAKDADYSAFDAAVASRKNNSSGEYTVSSFNLYDAAFDNAVSDFMSGCYNNSLKLTFNNQGVIDAAVDKINQCESLLQAALTDSQAEAFSQYKSEYASVLDSPAAYCFGKEISEAISDFENLIAGRADVTQADAQQAFEALPTPAITAHNFSVASDVPADNCPGGVYFLCSNCPNIVNAVSDSRQGAVPGDEFLKTAVPAPSIFCAGSSVRTIGVSPSGEDIEQGLRFNSFMKIPQGAHIIDFGMIYTSASQLSLEDSAVFGNPSAQSEGNDDTVPAAVKENLVFDSGVILAGVSYSNYNAVNSDEKWKNFTELNNFTVYDSSKNSLPYDTLEQINASSDAYYIEFNLVVTGLNSVAKMCSSRAARGYITYTFCGQTFTVYDDFVNSRNVYWVADKAYNSPSESSRAKDYLLNNVLLKCNPDYQAN